MRLDRLLIQAGALGVSVERHALGARRGDYADDPRVIRLNARLTTAQAVETLSHELGHAIHRDRETSEAVERRASITGAGLVLTAVEYRAAERIVGPHTGALAVELGVTPRVIQHWREWYRRSGGDESMMKEEVHHGLDREAALR